MYLGQLVPAPNLPELRNLSMKMAKEIQVEIQKMG